MFLSGLNHSNFVLLQILIDLYIEFQVPSDPEAAAKAEAKKLKAKKVWNNNYVRSYCITFS